MSLGLHRDLSTGPSTSSAPAPLPAVKEAMNWILAALVAQVLWGALLVFEDCPYGYFQGAWSDAAITAGEVAVLFLAGAYAGYVLLRGGRYPRASMLLFVLGIIELPLGAIIIGVFYLLAWNKIRRLPATAADMSWALAPSSAPSKGPASSLPASTVAPPAGGALGRALPSSTSPPSGPTRQCGLCTNAYDASLAKCPKCQAPWA